VKHGSHVHVGDDLATLHTNLIGSLDRSRQVLLEAIQIAGEKPAERPIILVVIRNQDSAP
jgi:thymidine phosphorylase